MKSFRISGSQPCLLQCRQIAARESSTSSRALLTCVMPPRAAYRLTAARYEFMAALYSAQSRSRSEQMRRIGLDRIAFGRELSAHGSRNRFLRPTYSMEFPKNAEFLSLNSGYVAAAERPLVLRKAGNYRFVTPDWFRSYRSWRSLRSGGRPKVSEEIRNWVPRLAKDNPSWGAEDSWRPSETRLRRLRALRRMLCPLGNIGGATSARTSPDPSPLRLLSAHHGSLCEAIISAERRL